MIAIGVPVRILELLGGLAVDAQIATVIAVETADDIEQRGLAAAGWSQNGHKLILPERDAHALERFHPRAAAQIGFYNVR